MTRLELGPLSAQDTFQIVRELSEIDGAQPYLPGDTRETSGWDKQPSAQPVQLPTSSLSLERFGAWLFAETKGQPFYLKALLQTLLEQGVLVPRLSGGSRWVFELHSSLLQAPLPDNLLPCEVRELIQRRLARLSPPARTLLAAGAILARNVCEARSMATAAALSHDSLLVATSSITLYTLSAILFSFHSDNSSQ